MTKASLSTAYCWLFSRQFLEKVNNYILGCALRARGYNNFQNNRVSGEARFLSTVLKKMRPTICLDVGANVGEYSRLMLESTAAAVYAFEPLPSAFTGLSKLRNKFGSRFVAVNKGVGAANELLQIHFSADATEHASFSLEAKNIPYVRNELSQEIEVITLDSFLASSPEIKAIDFLKIDTEGFEFEVLLGAKEALARQPPKMVQIEYNWHQLFKAQSLYSFSRLLSDYQVFQLLPNRLARRDPKDPYSNIYHFSNFVFVRNDCLHLVD